MANVIRCTSTWLYVALIVSSPFSSVLTFSSFSMETKESKSGAALRCFDLESLKIE
jgi:hypothetical protein